MPIDAALLFKQHHEGLFRYLFALTGDEALAKDAVQFSFLRLLERPPADDNAKAWLYRVATNAVREWGRSEGRRRRLLEARGFAPALGDEPVSPDREVEQVERREEAHRVLERLGERDRTLLFMREEGFTHREIADAVGTTTGAVGTLLARAIRKAAQAITEEAS
jgi:RNA polymerase sigma-70 factor (ECF subfamily)